uniref:NADH dehydrogenase [ubiquinone] 1 beta subcomplex subunit 1 n=2 Tax=Equus TaxID=9789 RepID=A0A9L0K0W7_EQUAS
MTAPCMLLPLKTFQWDEMWRWKTVILMILTLASMMNLIQLVRDHWVHILVPMGFVVGCYLDRKNDEKLTAFRNKSVLFKRELRPNEEVTWK